MSDSRAVIAFVIGKLAEHMEPEQVAAAVADLREHASRVYEGEPEALLIGKIADMLERYPRAAV
jgi:hypothetical protein